MHRFYLKKIQSASKLVVDYFSKFGRIDDYFRARKIERVKLLPTPLFGMSVEDDMFQEWELPQKK